jgi:hypothetical protein
MVVEEFYLILAEKLNKRHVALRGGTLVDLGPMH